MSSSEGYVRPSSRRTRRRRAPLAQPIANPSPGPIPTANYSDSEELRRRDRDIGSESDDTVSQAESDIDSDSESSSSDESRRAAKWRESVKERRSRRRLGGRRGRGSGSVDQSEEPKYKRFHYSKYYAHFHRRANQGQFSLSRALRNLVTNMSHFTTRYHKEILMVLFCIASALASLRPGTIKTKAAGRPGPFFGAEENSDGLVHDFYGGEYVDLARREIPFFPAFLFYYAHWDAESLEAKAEFLGVANYFRHTHPGVYKFYAINCWWPDGQCRQNFKTLSHFPIFVAHASSSLGTIYNGPIRSAPMIRFLESVLKPFTRIDSDEELWRFRAQHDAIMLTSMNSTEDDFDPSFAMYRQMALRNLESDPFSQVGFGLFIRRELGEKFFLATAKTISLVLFNEIHTAKWIPPDTGMKGPVGQVADWVTERTAKAPITWSYQVRNGFANKVITPGSFDLSEELKKRPVFVLVTRRYYPSAYSPFYSQLKEVALDYSNCNNSLNVTKLRRITHKLNAEWMKLWNSIHEICAGMYAQGLNSRCGQLWEQLEHWRERKRVFVRETLKNYEYVSEQLNFAGLSCRSTRPFRFIAIDPVDVPHFAELALGKVTVSPSPSAFESNRTYTHLQNSVPDPVAFIIDAQKEVILPVNTFNISEIARVIVNYTVESEKDTSAFGGQRSEVKSEGQGSSHEILTFSGSELDAFLKSAGPPLLLMYSAQFCGFCTVTLAHFVRLAQFLKELHLPVTLGKIDTYKHSLPATLAPENIPTFVFFPGHNRSESRVLSTNEPLTSQVLLKFLLSQLDAETRVQISEHRRTPNEIMQIRQENRGSVLRRIESLLGSLTSDPSLTQLHAEEVHSDLRVHLTPVAIDSWKSEVVEQLRSIQIRLDVE